MNLILDIGNTSIKAYCFEGSQVVDRFTTLTTDAVGLKTWLTAKDFHGAISCITGDVSPQLREILNGLDPLLDLRPATTPVPHLRNHYESAQTLGPDRLAAAVGAAMQKPGSPLLIFDVGTCLTIDFVDAEGNYLGGNISPGMDMRLKAMNEFTAHLPLASAEGAESTLGTNTMSALRNGAYEGLRLEIEGYIRTYLVKYPRLFVFLTGGTAISLDSKLKNTIFADEILVARGLNAILEHNE